MIAGRPTVFRRSRGYVPRAVRLRRPVRRPVLACGAHLKNTFCLAAGDEAWLGPHIGDLDNLEATRAFEEQVERLQRFLGIRPEVIAHDLHPDYASTRYALARPEAVEGRRCSTTTPTSRARWPSTASRARSSGLAWDGTGYGTDGTAWGGELLLVDGGAFERLATLRPLRLAGSDEAIRAGLAHRARRARRRLRRRAAARAAAALRRGARPRRRRRPADGRAGAPLAARPRRRPVLRRARRARARPAAGHATRGRWRSSGTSPPTRPRAAAYPVRARRSEGGLVQADLRPLVRAAVADLVGRRRARRASRRASTRRWPTWRRRWCGGPRRAHGPLPVVLTGRLLPERAARRGRAAAPAGGLRRAPARRGAAGRRRDRARPGAGGRRGGGGMTDAPDGVECGRRGGLSACAWRCRGRSSRSRARASCAWGRWTSPA